MTALVEEVAEGARAPGAERNRASMMGGPVHLGLERFRLHPLRLARNAPDWRRERPGSVRKWLT